MSKLTGISLAVSMALTAPLANAGVLPDYQTGSSWFTDGTAVVEQHAGAAKPATVAKNVILFVGDGMGISTLTAARIYQGQQAGQSGEENYLSFERFPYTGLAKTYNTNQQTPDSAGTMTAMITGVKTKAGVISLSDNVQRGDCSYENEKLVTALELAELHGKATGIVTTARITHATPAATYAHVSERDWEAGVSESCQGKVKDIALQLVENAPEIEVILGGGRRNFLPGSEGGKRADGRDLTVEWQQRYPERAAYISKGSELSTLDLGQVNHLMGLFNMSHMEYEADRAAAADPEPSLAEMTESALDILKRDQDGFFLMVEAGRIDHAHHAGNAARALEDTVALSDAVGAAIAKLDESGQLDDTLIIVTADHSHVFTMAGYPKRGNPILGLVKSVDGATALADDGRPYTTLGYANGPNAGDGTLENGTRRDLSGVDTTAADFMQQAAVPMDSETHAGEDVAIFARGPGSNLVEGDAEQNIIFHVINQTARLDAKAYQTVSTEE